MEKIRENILESILTSISSSQIESSIIICLSKLEDNNVHKHIIQRFISRLILQLSNAIRIEEDKNKIVLLQKAIDFLNLKRY